MLMFQPKHEEQLRDHFAGAFAARMGLKSWAGPMLDHAMAVGVVPIRGSDEYMPVAPMDHSAARANREVGTDAIQAVRDEKSIRAALRSMDPEPVLVLRLHYTPVPPTATRPLVAYVLGEQHAYELTLSLASKDRVVRRAAKKELESAQHRAGKVLEVAQEAYVVAHDTVIAAAREERRVRFERSLGGPT